MCFAAAFACVRASRLRAAKAAKTAKTAKTVMVGEAVNVGVSKQKVKEATGVQGATAVEAAAAAATL